MSRALLTLALFGSALFAAAIGLIRAQPYQDGGLRVLLQASADCPAPCWQGIRPGVTTRAQALAILQEHGWIDEITVADRVIGFGADVITWQWSGQEPPVLTDEVSAMWVEEQIVKQIAVPTEIPFGEVWLLLGKPEIGLLSSRQGRLNHTAFYGAGTLRVDTRVWCPLRRQAFWTAPVLIRLSEPESTLTIPYRLPEHDTAYCATRSS